MAHTYFCIGSYYGGGRTDELVRSLRNSGIPNYSILINEQDGKGRVSFATTYNALLNCAFADPECEFAWALGDDIFLGMGTLAKTQARMVNKEIGIIAPSEGWLENGVPVTYVPFTNEKKRADLAMADEEIDNIFTGYACACIRREAWEAVGPLDEALGRGYGEDLDWGVRCWQARFRCANWRGEWFLHTRGGTYGQLIKEGKFGEGESYEAAERAKIKWPFLWRESSEDTLKRLQNWRIGGKND